MASPNISEVIAMFRGVIRPYEKLRKAAAVDSTDNWLYHVNTLTEALKTDYPTNMTLPLEASEGRLAALLADAAAPMVPVLIEWAKLYGFPERDPVAILVRLFRHFVEVSGHRVTSRQFTFGTPSAATANVGNGQLLRLTKDSDDFDIENCHADTKTLRCISDASFGAPRHEEVFEIRGGAASKNALQLTGSGAISTIAALSARGSRLINPSFSIFGGTIAAITSLQGWTTQSGDFSAFRLDEDDYYRDFVGDTTPRSLVFTGNDTLIQDLVTNQRTLTPDLPWLLKFAYKRDLATGSAPGTGATLTAYLGAASRTFNLNTGTGWQSVYAPIIGDDCWPVNFNEATMRVRFAVAGLGSGEEVAIDDVILAPATAFDGLWYWLFGGSTRFALDDVFTCVDTAVGAVIQEWLWRTYGVYWPHDTGTPVNIAEV